MYEQFYNLTCPPFQNTPNTRFFFETDQHKEALAKIEYTVRHRRGFALVTGDIGTGKTTLIRTLVRRLGDEAQVAVINNTRVTARQLLKLITTDWQIDTPGYCDKATLLSAISEFVEAQRAMGKTAVVVIDEGQCLGVDELEELRLLTNLEDETDKLVQLLILGQPELREKLRHRRLLPLTQRIVMYMHLEPLSFDEMARYIAFRLERASRDKPNVDFSRQGLRLIHERSKGVPRLINLVCDNALLVGYSRDTHLIDDQVVYAAVTQMMPNFHGEVRDVFANGGPPGSDQEVEDGRRV